MDLKEKFKTFINKPLQVLPHAAAPQPPQAASAWNASEAALERRACVTREVSDPEAEQTVLDSIQPSFFESLDPSEVCREQLKMFPPSMDVNLVNAQRQILRKQLTVVSKKVSDMILHCQPEHSQELERVMLLQEELLQTLAVCQTARQSVQQAQAHFTAGGLGVLANYRHRQTLRTVLRPLHTIKTLQMTEARLEDLLRAEDYPGCIQLLQECLKVAAAYRHFSCVSDMTTKLQDTLDMAEEQLDVGLSKLCTRFDEQRYERLQAAYRLLGKTQTAADQLLMHMTTAVHTASSQVVLGHVQLARPAGADPASVQKRQYPDLCTLIPSESVLPCLTDLCRVLWGILYNYHSIVQWHRRRVAAESPAPETESAELGVNRRYVAQKLEHGRCRIWQDVQGRVRAYLLATDLAHFKFDDFIQILDVVHRLLEIGEQLSGQEGGPLEEAVKKQCVAFFRVYHRSRLEELRMFLENEAWEVCPVRPSFSINSLQEFKQLRRQNLLCAEKGAERTASARYFETYDTERNPFDVRLDATVDEDILGAELTDEESDEEPDELKVDQVEEAPGDGHHRQTITSPRRAPAVLSPPVSSTALHLLRLCGRYLRMMALLRTVALDVVVCLSQLFDFYLYTVYSLFSSPEDNGSSPRLLAALQRISDHLIQRPEAAAGPAASAAPWSGERVPPAALNPAVELRAPESLYGLPARLVAAESLVFIAGQLEQIRDRLENNIPQSKRLYVQQFYGQTVAVAADVRGPVYFPVTSRLIDSDVILMRMANVNWEVKDLCSQHNAYVELILRDLQVFSMRLEEVSRRLPVPKAVYDTLWDQCIRLANRAFVEGFASAKRCSNEGRALMQLDYQQFVTKLERMTRLRPLPERSLVEAYVKAYYVPEAGLEDWIRQHKEYTRKQVTALIGCMSHVGKRARTRLVALLEEEGRR